MATYETNVFRKNLKIEIDKVPWVIIDFQHVKPGKGVAFVKTRIKNLITGRVLWKTFRSGDKVDVPDLEERDMEYLYQDGENYVFMDTSNYEQVFIQGSQIEEALPYLLDNLQVTILFFQGKAISVDLPTFVIMEITQTDPGEKGDRVQGGTKPATLQTGILVNVPLYIKQNEKIKVDTRTGSYVERVKS